MPRPSRAKDCRCTGSVARAGAGAPPGPTCGSRRPGRDTRCGPRMRVASPRSVRWARWSAPRGRAEMEYVRDGAEIYRQSFATIRAEADLSGLPADVARIAVRMIHACGMVDLAADIGFSTGVVTAARKALLGGAPILCDAEMVASGVTRKRLPAGNEVICTLRGPSVPALAAEL